ncbi:hypothetical protein PHET_04141 [Paragonimus heterotremus]|uniref:Uncharacterized protein n=1 Tax=Paragonimus heterotremus TaxID=100268 RepID=A0A8J4TGB9_9TREM|nr:hypothetical protein PHET_04141 [Paragonimus heterotremus]
MQTNYNPCHMACSNPPSVETKLVKAYMSQSTKTPVLHWHDDQLAHEVRYSLYVLSRKISIIMQMSHFCNRNIVLPKHSCLPPVTQTQKSCLSRSNSQRRANNTWVNDFVSVSSNNQSCTLSRSSSQRRSPVAWRPASPTTIQRSPTNRLSRSQSLQRRSPNAWLLLASKYVITTPAYGHHSVTVVRNSSSEGCVERMIGLKRNVEVSVKFVVR